MDCVLEFARTREGDYYFRINEKNGKPVAQSEPYETLHACRNALHAVIDAAKSSVFVAENGAFWTGKAVYEVFEQEDGYTFLLKGDYGEVLAYGAGFKTLESCRAAIDKMSAMDFGHQDEYSVF